MSLRCVSALYLGTELQRVMIAMLDGMLKVQAKICYSVISKESQRNQCRFLPQYTRGEERLKTFYLSRFDSRSYYVPLKALNKPQHS